MSKSNQTPSVVRNNNRIYLEPNVISRIIKHHHDYVQGVAGVKPYDNYEKELAAAERNYLRAVNPTMYTNVNEEDELFEAIKHLDNLETLKYNCISSILFDPQGLRQEIYKEIKKRMKAQSAPKP